VDEQKDDDNSIAFFDAVNDPPISQAVTITPGQRSLEPPDIRMIVGIVADLLKAAIQLFDQGASARS
jgi:hypothetical protein